MGRGFIPKDVVLDKLAVGRASMVLVCTNAKINSPEYRAASEAKEALDRLAELLTGDPEYFWVKKGPSPHSR